MLEVVSMVHEDWNQRHPILQPFPNQNNFLDPPEVSKAEFEALKKEVESLKKLLKAAKIYDEETGQENCEMEEKTKLLKEVAKWLGIDLEDLYE